jgi:hypothetical protein
MSALEGCQLTWGKPCILVAVDDRIELATGAVGQFEAEKAVLDKCNTGSNALGPCFLYAVGNQVVLPQRSTKPLSDARSDSRADPVRHD